MIKLEQPALHRQYIKEGKMTEEESDRLVSEAQKREDLEEESKRLIDEANHEDSIEEEENNRYPYGD